MSVSPRHAFSIVVALAVAWLGGLILGEYPFDGFTPVLGGFLLGVSTVGAAAYVSEAEDPPAWVTVIAAALAVWGIWRAAWIDAGAEGELLGLIPTDGIGPLPSVAWWAMAAAGAGALFRLVPKRRRPEPADED